MPVDLEHLRSPRLLLDRFGTDDVDAVYAIYGDPDTWRHLPEGRFDSRDRVVAMRERSDASWAAVGLGDWVVRSQERHDDLAAGAVLGTVSTTALWRDGAVWALNLGYRFVPASWGRGFATEAASAAHEAARARGLDIPVTARALTNNPGSIAVLDRLGLVRLWEGASAEAPTPDPAEPLDTRSRARVVYADRRLSRTDLEALIALG